VVGVVLLQEPHLLMVAKVVGVLEVLTVQQEYLLQLQLHQQLCLI
jgi:hypothetical protein